MRIKRKYLALVAAVVLLAAYVGAFVIVHTSDTLIKPAANMAYYYYSDNPAIENLEFYGFWPLRHIGYHIPGFEMRHNDERLTHRIVADHGDRNTFYRAQTHSGRPSIAGEFPPRKPLAGGSGRITTAKCK